MDFRFDIGEGQEVQILSRSFTDAGIRLDNLKGFYEEALQILKKHSDELFKTAGQAAESVPKWAPHKPSTLNARTKRHGYYKNTPNRPGLLRWTGKMQDSARMTATEKQGRLEYTDPKAMHHWVGGGKSKLPSRKILELSPNINREITRALQTAVYRELGLAGIQSLQGL